MPDRFDQGGRELLAAGFTFVDRHRLVVVLGAAVAVLAVEADGWRGSIGGRAWVYPVLAVWVGAVGSGGPYGLNLTQKRPDLSKLGYWIERKSLFHECFC